MSEELNKCPFCGSDNLRCGEEEGWWSVCCDDCDCIGPQNGTEKIAVIKWNTRADAEARSEMTDEEAAEAFARTKCDCPKSLWDEYYMCTQHKDPIKSFLAGVEYGRKHVQQRERMAWEAARLVNWEFNKPYPQPTPLTYIDDRAEWSWESFDDWKKSLQSFNPAQDEAEHLAKIRKVIEGEE